MSILIHQLKLYGSAVMPDTDTITEIGGAIDRTKRITLTDIAENFSGVSSSASDTTQIITVSYRETSTGEILTVTITLNGTNLVSAGLATVDRILKAVKDFTTVGDVAIVGATVQQSGTAQAGSTTTTIKLNVGASAVDDTYLGMIVRLTGGTGVNQLREIISYNGTTKVATVNHPWSTTPDATTTFQVRKGLLFDKNPVEVFEVRRPFFNAAADAGGGTDRKFYEKVFFENRHTSINLTTAKIIEDTDPFDGGAGLVATALDPTKDSSLTNGAGNNRQVAPSGLTFDSTDKDVVGTVLNAGETQGCWLELTLDAGETADNQQYILRIEGDST